MLANLMYHVDRFRIYKDDGGARRIACDGWIHHRNQFDAIPNSRLRMVLSVPGEVGFEIQIEDRERRSLDVSAVLGPDAATSRFSVDAPIRLHGARLGESRLRVETPSGDELSISLGDRLEGNITDLDREAAESDLVMKFEGIGNNCEFGLMQREVGFNRMGLLRLTGSFSNAVLAEAFRNSFSDFGEPDDLDLWLRGTEWMATSRRYGFELHTYKYHPEWSEERIRTAESTKLRFQASMMLENIEEPVRTLLRRQGAGDDPSAMDELYAAIRSHGPAKLLWVVCATEAKPHGLVERRPDGSFVGYHGSLARTNWPTEFDKAAWISLLGSAESYITLHGDLEAAGSVTNQVV